MRKLVPLILTLCAVLPASASAQQFIYSYRDAAKDAKTWRVCVGALRDGKVTSEEVAAADDLRMFYAFVGAGGDNVVLRRYGERQADWLNLKTRKINPIALDVVTPLWVTPTEFTYLALAPGSETSGTEAVLKRFVFADANSTTVSDAVVVRQAPFAPNANLGTPADRLWGIFLEDGAQVLGSVDMASGKFTRVAPLPEDVLWIDISPDGKSAAVSSRASTPAVSDGSKLNAKVELIDTVTGKSRVLVNSAHAQIPANPGVAARFSAVFAGSGHVLYPETVTDAQGAIEHQRLMDYDLATDKSTEIARINDKNRLINASPIHVAGSTIEWGEYAVDETTREAKVRKRGDNKVYSIENGDELSVGGKLIGYVGRGVPVLTSDGAVAFSGSLTKDGKAAMYLYKQGMSSPAPLAPEGTQVRTFAFLEPKSAMQ